MLGCKDYAKEAVRMPKHPTKRQTRYLLSKGSPLSKEQKERFKRELHSGKVKVRKGKGK